MLLHFNLDIDTITFMKLSKSRSVDGPIVVETVQQFLERGGKITQCPPRRAQGASMYAQVIAVDGYELPVLGATPVEYVPNFVKDSMTYDIAQQDIMSPLHDGTTQVMRDDERVTARNIIRERNSQVLSQTREGCDGMEED